MKQPIIEKKAKSLLILFLSISLFAIPLQAEDAAFPEDTGPAPEESPASETATSVQAEMTEAGKYYLDFKAASLINVLNVLSSISGINFVAGRELADRQVNMTLDNVSLDDVLQSLSKGCNVTYDFLQGKNIYLFRASADQAEKPPLMTKVFKLYYVHVSQIKQIETGSSTGSSSSSSSGSGSGSSSGGGLTTLSDSSSDENDLEGAAIYKAIEKILSERGKVSVDDRSNSLIVTDAEDRLRMIESAIAQLDRPLDQVLINVLLVETFEDLDRELGVEWGDPTNGTFGTITGGAQATSFPFLNTGGVAAPTSLATNGDNNPTNIWNGLYRGFKDIGKQFNPTNATGSITTVGTRDFTDFQVTVKAMENSSKLKILAKPKILVMDNHPALVKIATDTAIGTTSTTAAAGGSAGTTTESAERSEVGTILRVTPLINTGNRITMTVEPTFATVDASAISVGGFAAQDPTVRTARTTMMVNDGQTIALGGLLLSQQSNGNRKVPFFGNIPLIGKAFFTGNSKSLQDRELILFVTPYIVRDPSVLETPRTPDKRLRYDDETAPFWKVKQKEWYKKMSEGKDKPIDYEQYFDVRKKLMDSVLTTLDQNDKAAAK